jgi:methylamine dehydrogenase accessory protein MauD
MQTTTLDGEQIVIARPGSTRSQLLLFVAPDCPISTSLLPVVGTFARTEPWLDLLLVSDGDNIDEHRAFAAAGGDLNYALSEPIGRAFGVSKLPYAVLIDEGGLVAGMGIVNSREHLESLFEAKERGIASIQEFMAASDQFYRADESS